MIVNKAYRYRLYPTRNENDAKTFGCVRFIYNKMLVAIDNIRNRPKS